MPGPTQDPDVIFELTTIGTVTRVAAVDVATGTEVSLQGPASTSAGELKRLALQKLRWVMGKRKT